MSASLVGSEMCIRDSSCIAKGHHMPQWGCQRSAPLAQSYADSCCWPSPIHLKSRRATPTCARPRGALPPVYGCRHSAPPAHN
eukprot:4067559-Alexandrium_andersonii.AAC.1